MKKNKVKIQVKKRTAVFIILSIVVFSMILYGVAYRYLIERVETPVAKNLTDSSRNNSDINNDEKSTEAKTEVNADDWNYKSDSIEINIDKVEKGNGNDKVTYYVADVKVKNSSYINSAFAKSTFGRNIVETTSDIAKDNEAIFAINGDYYGFRGDGVLIRNGKVYRDVPARAAAAFYNDGEMKTIDEKQVSAEELVKNGVTNTFSFGPVLVKDGAVIENFETVAVDTNFGNRSIQGLNPRTGIGVVEPNHFIFIVVDGRKENYSKGMTLSQLAQVFKDYGCKEAYNLDGGGSSTMYFMGRVVNSPLGEGNERKISDILYIKE